MWLSHNNLQLSRRDGARAWHFGVWMDFVGGVEQQRIFYWDDRHVVTGVIELVGDRAVNIKRLRQRIARLASDATYRRRFRRPLRFPIERHYSCGEPLDDPA